jgi:hypothetical protein
MSIQLYTKITFDTTNLGKISYIELDGININVKNNKFSIITKYENVIEIQINKLILENRYSNKFVDYITLHLYNYEDEYKVILSNYETNYWS